ncbi:MAG TPA: VC0807 family protein [Rhodocyclaceae bacterium]|nr:VC0807 family protein [Rhodocyclaceae bacterium]
MNLLRTGFGTEIIVNAALPWLVYILAQPGMGRVHALMASALPPLVWSVIQLVQKRRIDALSILVLAGIGLSLAAFFGGGSFRMLELREQLVTGVMALVLLGSVVIKRPMFVVVLRSMMKDKSPAETVKLQRLLDDPRRLTRMTLAIGLLGLAQTAIAIGLVFTLPVREFLIVSPILTYAVMGLFVGVVLYTRHRARAAAAETEHDD